jgi:hypothetical protein
MINVPIAWDIEALDRLFANFGKPVDGIYDGPAIVNDVSVIVADSNAVAGDTLDGFRVTDDDSQTAYGAQATRPIVTILANTSEAQALAEYLQVPAPVYWFSGIQLYLGSLTASQQDLVANLDIGDPIIVSKRFPNVAAPVVEQLAVEGIDHQITPRDGHVVTIYTGPTVIYDLFQLDISDLDNAAYGLG